MRFLTLAPLWLAILSCSPDVRSQPVIRPVAELDIGRFAGKWYEIARMPLFFEDGLVNTTATYTLRPDGTVEVKNEGYRGKPTGNKETALGNARRPDSNQPARLFVSFFPVVESDYIVFALDTAQYSYAMVTSGPRYLWVLSRTPSMDETLYGSLLQKAQSAGFDLSSLQRVTQSW